MTLNELKELIELVAEKGFAELEIERSGFRLKIVANQAPVAPSSSSMARHATPLALPLPASLVEDTPVQRSPSNEPTKIQSPPVVQSVAREVDELETVKSPIVGTFYRAPGPTADPFVKIGDRIEVGKVLCIVEAMKLMNEIESDVSGEIVKIFVENGQPVEYGQPLFGVRP